MGIGAALQQIGGSVMNWGMQRKDAQAQQKQQQDEAAKQQKLLLERQAALQRLQVPPEKVVQLYDEQLKKAINVRSQWQINEDGTSGSWVETGRDTAVPESKPAFQKFRQGDEEVSAFIDPATGTVQEVGRGNAFAPSQRRAFGGSGGSGGRDDADGGGGGGIGAPKPSGKAADWTIEGGVRVNKLTGEEVPLQRVQQSMRETEEAKARGEGSKDLLERATAAQQQLAIIDRLEALHKQGIWTGPVDQYVAGSGVSKQAQEYDALTSQLLGPTVKEMFGSAQLSNSDREAAAKALPGRGNFEDVNKQLLQQMREKAMKTIEQAKGLKAGGPSGSAPNGAPETNPAQKGSSKANPLPVSSEAEADKLPPGVFFVLNGRLGVSE